MSETLRDWFGDFDPDRTDRMISIEPNERTFSPRAEALIRGGSRAYYPHTVEMRTTMPTEPNGRIYPEDLVARAWEKQKRIDMYQRYRESLADGLRIPDERITGKYPPYWDPWVASQKISELEASRDIDPDAADALASMQRVKPEHIQKMLSEFKEYMGIDENSKEQEIDFSKPEWTELKL